MIPFSLPFNLSGELSGSIREYCSIGSDLLLFDSSAIASFPARPVKLTHVMGAICMSGTVTVLVNMTEYTAAAPCMLIVHSRQALQFNDPGEGFRAEFMIMSEGFAGNLFDNAEVTLPIFLSAYDCPLYLISNDLLLPMQKFYELLVNAVRQTANPWRAKVVRHLLNAHFYSVGYSLHHSAAIPARPGEPIVSRFFPILGEHCRRERSVEFYAGKLFITPNYLSRVIRENTGKTVGDWIESHVIAEAKALLGSTGMTIQQISEELNFPTQSFFGKYFKRIAGISPRDYRRSLRVDALGR
ncbi:MAG: AraC family transcriptional regulator [Tannerellaceae bacterium]|jgi:AraC-like DNA-binding protein|nr:AraC family transcriptional regulator [Tannerellaceae bacterium]